MLQKRHRLSDVCARRSPDGTALMVFGWAIPSYSIATMLPPARIAAMWLGNGRPATASHRSET